MVLSKSNTSRTSFCCCRVLRRVGDRGRSSQNMRNSQNIQTLGIQCETRPRASPACATLPPPRNRGPHLWAGRAARAPQVLPKQLPLPAGVVRPTPLLGRPRRARACGGRGGDGWRSRGRRVRGRPLHAEPAPAIGDGRCSVHQSCEPHRVGHLATHGPHCLPQCPAIHDGLNPAVIGAA